MGKSPSFFKKISEKYAYLVPWKNLSFADWCEILDTNPDLAGTFKNNVKISELSVTDITKALTNARFKGYYTLDTLDLVVSVYFRPIFWIAFKPRWNGCNDRVNGKSWGC